MDIKDILTNASVPQEHWDAIYSQMAEANTKADGMLWHKIKVRYGKAGKIAKMFRPDVERLVDIDPKYIDLDVAPVDSVTCNGDNNLWGYRYIRGDELVWLNHDLPENAGERPRLLAEGFTTDGVSLSIPVGQADPATNPNYEAEKARSYWTKGKYHQRTPQSWKIWYRRNGGEGYAWRLGMPVNLAQTKDMWKGSRFTVYRIGDVYGISGHKKVLGSLGFIYSMGYEVANVWDFENHKQKHKPAKGYGLKAALTWSTIIRKIKD